MKNLFLSSEEQINLYEYNFEKEKMISSYVINTILTYFPTVEDRLSFLDNANTAPEFEIEIHFNKNETKIGFMIGTRNYKTGTIEKAKANYYIEVQEIQDIINFILTDHEVIKYIGMNQGNQFELGFAINWTQENIKGISCNDIKLKIKFNNNIELRNHYIMQIIEEYLDYLEKTPSFNKIRNEFLHQYKVMYFNSMTKDELLKLISEMEESKIKALLFEMDNNTFIEVMTNSNSDCKYKKLGLSK